MKQQQCYDGACYSPKIAYKREITTKGIGGVC